MDIDKIYAIMASLNRNGIYDEYENGNLNIVNFNNSPVVDISTISDIELELYENLLELVKTAECYQDRALFAEQIVGAYLTFEKCGFNEVKELEAEANKLGIKLANSVDTVKTGTIDTTVETVNRTIETVKPYAEQAKKQLNVFGGFVKNAASEGAKRLIKILDESNDKKDE